MTREEFQRLCRERIVFLDGATGTNLQKAGMPTGVSGGLDSGTSGYNDAAAESLFWGRQ